MKLVMLRHAARSVNEFGDTPLNALGLNQAESLSESIQPRGSLPQPTRLVSSPKKRALETLSPLATAEHIEIEIDPQLDERHHGETLQEFETRVREFLEHLQETHMRPGARETCVYLCSHLDWLEISLALLPSNLSDRELEGSWRNCEYRVFRLSDGIWSLGLNGVITGKG